MSYSYVVFKRACELCLMNSIDSTSSFFYPGLFCSKYNVHCLFEVVFLVKASASTSVAAFLVVFKLFSLLLWALPTVHYRNEVIKDVTIKEENGQHVDIATLSKSWLKVLLVSTICLIWPLRPISCHSIKETASSQSV
uniref:Uncharacterized protein n=1 Tax=Glossina brevipalpis TaxID=37001 RepID=A0A1A9WUP9_9MUSC